MSSDSPFLTEGYRRCAAITRRHGTTYYWGAALLPADRRRHVHAVYTLARAADDIVDSPGATSVDAVAHTRARLGAFQARFREALQSGRTTNPVLGAVVATIRECGIEAECFDRFFTAMSLDLTQSSYETWEDLLKYMEGSAAVIGEMMLPVLQPRSTAAKEPARALGLAFQLTNFLRDIGEDLTRGRVYVPQADLRRFGADPHQRQVTPQWRAFMADQVKRNQSLYEAADAGIPLLPPNAARCVGTARVLYAMILDRIAANDYDVFRVRARVPTATKVRVAAEAMVGRRPPAPRPVGPASRGPALSRNRP